MTPSRPPVLGTRSSPLAMAQAEEARARLCAAHGWAEDAVELVPVLSSGDKIQDRPLAEIGGKALWTRELDACLHDGGTEPDAREPAAPVGQQALESDDVAPKGFEPSLPP